MIPIKYNLRNLRIRWVTTLLTVLGTALVVASSCVLFGMVEGLQNSLKVSGDPLDLIVLRKGSTNETGSGVDAAKVGEIATIRGVGRDKDGKPLCAGELLNIPVCERANGSRANLMIRGIDPVSPEMRPDFKILEGGRMIEPKRGECLVARPISGRFKGTRMGETLRCGERETYKVVGIFTAGGSAAESEVWVDRRDLEQNIQRTGSISVVQVRAKTPADLDAIQAELQKPQYNLLAMKESDYFAEQQITGKVLMVIGTVIAVLLSIGAMFAAANTMFAAVKSRTREIGTLRALGFARRDVLLCFLGESVILCSLGGLLGWLATIPMSALTFGTSDYSSFAERTIQFRFGPLVFGVAFAMTMAMGVFGGLFPALRAIKLDVIKALREV